MNTRTSSGAPRALWGFSLKFTDRKSTRLNSSHSQISYAVFCLKKKKNYQFPSILLNTSPLLPHHHHAIPSADVDHHTKTPYLLHRDRYLSCKHTSHVHANLSTLRQ